MGFGHDVEERSEDEQETRDGVGVGEMISESVELFTYYFFPVPKLQRSSLMSFVSMAKNRVLADDVKYIAYKKITPAQVDPNAPVELDTDLGLGGQGGQSSFLYCTQLIMFYFDELTR